MHLLPLIQRLLKVDSIATRSLWGGTARRRNAPRFLDWAALWEVQRRSSNDTGARQAASDNDYELAGSQDGKKDQPTRTTSMVRTISDSLTCKPRKSLNFGKPAQITSVNPRNDQWLSDETMVLR
jgi:hypothetical protein